MRFRFHFKKASDALNIANVFNGEVSDQGNAAKNFAT